MTSAKKKRLVTWIGIYVLADEAVIPTTCKTDAGFHYETEPVVKFDYRNRDEFISTLTSVINAGNPLITAPSPEQIKRETPVMQKYLKAKSWKEVQRRSIFFSIECFEDDIQVITWGRAADGGWTEESDVALDRTFPISNCVQEVVDCVLDHLSKRAEFAAASN